MVLPHKQDDPAGTYLEAAGLGAPVIGYANRALGALVARERLGWVTPMGSIDALVDGISSLAADPVAVTRAANAGIRFMSRHNAASEFERRVNHLIDAVGSSTP